SLDGVVGHPDITDRLKRYVEKNDLPNLLLSGPAGVGKCVTGETPVLTNRGVERMADVVEEQDGFGSPDPELQVATFDHDGSIRFVKPERTYAKTTDRLVSLSTRDGGKMDVTPEHPLLVIDGDGLSWKPAEELEPEDRIARPLTLPTPETDGRLEWIDALDPERTFVDLAPSFAEKLETDIPRKTIREYEREFRDRDLDEAATTCSLAYLTELDVARTRILDAIESIRHVSLVNNQRSRPITPPRELSPELASFVGLAISEARIDGGRVQFYNEDESLLREFEATATEIFGAETARGKNKGVPFVEICNKALTHFLESCFDAFSATTTGEGIGSTLQSADEESRAAFLRAVFDAEGYVSPGGIVELTQKNERLITLLGYMLGTFGIEARRKTERKAGSNASGIEREYHTLLISGSRTLERFEDAIGFTLDRKADRLSDAAARDPNPNYDTIPVQRSVDALCESLYLKSSKLTTEALDPETPGRENYLDDLTRVRDAALDRLETAQDARERLQRLRDDVGAVTSLPAGWIANRDALAPIETRRDLSHATGVRTDYLLENDDHDLGSLPRFLTLTDQVESHIAEMLSADVLADLRELERIVDADLHYDVIESVECVETETRVYDLTVPGTHNYVAGNVPTVMHNTASATAVARELYGEDWSEHFLELNASDERGIDVVRDRIKSFARSSFGGAEYRIIFLDEADALCVPPGTEVVTGYPSSPEVKPIEDVSEDGEPIPSVDFETNEIQSDKGRLVDSGVADFFELELDDGRTITASLTHPFFVVGEDGELVEKELRELTPGDEIADFKDEIGVSTCDICGDWTAGRFCSVECNTVGHDLMEIFDTPEWRIPPRTCDRQYKHEGHSREFDPALVSDGGRGAVQTTEIRRIEHSHRGKAYNITMENTPNFMLGNGILTHNTSQAQSALRRTMEQFSHNTRFILSCNYSSQIIDPIQSRCAVFRFAGIADEAVATRIREIADEEGIAHTDGGIDALVYAADGDMRKAINALQAAAVMGETVDEEAVYTITATARPEEIEEMVTEALAGNFTAARATLDSLLTEKGLAGGDVIDQLHRSVWEFDLDDEAAVRLLDRIGEADYRIAEGANERVQLEALLASVALENGA
ncbi:MAG: replication factor C small subunit, partial [Halobacteriales archaeon]